jgi:hypothetical protein
VVIDAGAVATGEGSIEVTGRRAEILPPGGSKWQPLPAGAGLHGGISGCRVGGTLPRLGGASQSRPAAIRRGARSDVKNN